jgi:hypothetical protein
MVIPALFLGGFLFASASTGLARLEICDSKGPHFEMFSVPPEVVTHPKLNLASHPIGRRFRTVIRDAVRENPPNLAGHFLVITWGCGTACSQFAIVNLRSGEIWHDPEVILTRGLATQATSGLVIINPAGGSFADRVPTSFYAWRDGRLEGLCQLNTSSPLDIRGGSPNPSLQRTILGRLPGYCR